MEGFLSKRIEKIGDKEVLKINNTVSFFIIDKKDNLLLCNQYRVAIKGNSYSFFGGYIDEGESIEEALFRELYEETNITKDQVLNLKFHCKELYRAQGYSSEKNSICEIMVENIEDINIACNDVDENISFIKINLKDLDLNKFNGLSSFFVMKTVKFLKEINRVNNFDKSY